MTEYIVSARKYRPDTFESLVGQDNIARTLKNSIVRGQLAHAYLFCGPRGVGKTSTARIFAKTINCSDPTPDMEPCGKCESCISFSEGRSYCIHELDAASNNGVDDIKALMEQVRIPPQVGRYSVYIIDEVHMLSQSAFNAFLKTLEEPPAHAIFILATTEKHKILPTILSRCQTYDFNRITVGDMVRNLRHIAENEHISIDDESLHVIAAKADGAMRDALTIFDQTVAFCGTEVRYQDVLANLNVLDYEHCFSLVDDFLSGDYAAALLKFDEVLSKGFNALHFVAALSRHFRDLIVSRSSGLDALLELPDSLKQKYREQASRCSMHFLYECLNITTQCESGYRMSVNPRLHIEFALMRLSFLVRTQQQASAPLQSAASSQSAAPSQTPQQVSRPAQAARQHPTLQQQQSVQHAQPIQPEQQSQAAQPAQPGQQSQPIQPGQSAPSAQPVPPASSEQQSQTARPVKPSQPEQLARPSGAQPESVSHEAAQSASVPEEQPRPRRRVVASASSLSIKSMMTSKDQAPASDASSANGTDHAVQPLPDKDAVRRKWSELVSAYASQPRLANTLSAASLEFEDTDDGKMIVRFTVLNDAQKKWIEDKRLNELEARIQRLAGSPRILLRVAAPADEQVAAAPYTPSEKAKDLMRSNEEVRNLVSDFGLDVK